jgi:hypothetical protein
VAADLGRPDAGRTAFDLSALQAAAAEGTAGFAATGTQQTALSGSTQSATDQLLAGIQSRSGSGASGQGYTQQVLAGALGRGTPPSARPGPSPVSASRSAGGAEPYLNSSTRPTRRPPSTWRRPDQRGVRHDPWPVADVVRLDLRRDAPRPTTASSRRSGRRSTSPDRRQGKAFDESQQFAHAESDDRAGAAGRRATRSKYGGYSSAAEQQAARAKGLGAMLQQRVQSALGDQQQAAQFDQDQADMAMAAQAWLQGQKAKTSPVGDTAYGAIHGMGNQLGPQQSPLGLLTGLKAGLARRWTPTRRSRRHTPDVAPAPGSSVFQQQTSGQQPSTAGLEAALRKLFTGRRRRGRGSSRRAARKQPKATLSASTPAAPGRTRTPWPRSTPCSTRRVRLPAVGRGRRRPAAGGGARHVPGADAADQVSADAAQRDLSSLNQTGQTYEEQQAAALRAATQAPKDAATELDNTISDATGGWDPADLKNLSGLSESTIAKLVTAPDWSGQINSTEPGIQDLVNLAIQKVLANDADGQTALEQLLSASDLTTQQKRLIRAQVQSATGINPTTKASGTAPTA